MKTIHSNGKHALKPLVEDKRDFSLGGVFGYASLADVPNTDFDVAVPLKIKDQGPETDYCSAYAVTEVSEDQECVELLPEYQFYLTKKISGDPEAWGADLRSACKAAIIGMLPVQGFESFQGISREAILADKTWPGTASMVATVHKKETFFSVDGPHDVFDNIRAALWQHKADKDTIVTGTIWHEGWIDAPGGVIPEEYGQEGEGHAFKFFGQKVINGELYLKAQLSQGDQVGDSGIFYFSRAVVNREIGKFGIYMFKDMPREQAEYYMSQSFNANTPLVGRLWSIIKTHFF